MRYIVNGGKPVHGKIEIYSAKNAILPIIAAAVAKGGKTVLSNCPKFLDVLSAINVVRFLGCDCYYEGKDLVINSKEIRKWKIPCELSCKFRGSMLFLSSLLVRFGKAEIGLPGGCTIGKRPIDLHIKGFETLGATTKIEGNTLHCELENPIDNDIYLNFPSVGATQNLLIYTKCKGLNGKIINAAKEPENDDLLAFLNSSSEKYEVMPDRIVSSTYLIAAAMTGGEIELQNVNVSDLESVLSILVNMGCRIKIGTNKLTLIAPEKLTSPEFIQTGTYPSFPTDVQAMIVAACSIANGTTVIKENIFEKRFSHCFELNKMGADIKVNDKIAVVKGVNKLKSANTCGHDLRGTAALILAALSNEGRCQIAGIPYLSRGYINFADSLKKLGCNIFATEM